jgi:hypothetical protein
MTLSGSFFFELHLIIQKYEYVWRGFFVLILIVGALLFQKVYIFQTNPHFDDIKVGSVTDMLIYGLPFAVVFSVH